MKKLILGILIIAAGSLSTHAQGPGNKELGFGIILIEPTGITGKYWISRVNAVTASIGGSYFGSFRIGADYLWHFDTFRSSVAKMYTSIGGVIGIGDGWDVIYKRKGEKFYVRDNDDFGLGARAAFGINLIPRQTPLEIFFEMGVLVGLAPNFGASAEAAIGLRFYP